MNTETLYSVSAFFSDKLLNSNIMFRVTCHVSTYKKTQVVSPCCHAASETIQIYTVQEEAESQGNALYRAAGVDRSDKTTRSLHMLIIVVVIVNITF